MPVLMQVSCSSARTPKALWREFQIADKDEVIDPLVCTDHLWIARWLLHRIAEEENITVSFENKPVKGD